MIVFSAGLEIKPSTDVFFLHHEQFPILIYQNFESFGCFHSCKKAVAGFQPYRMPNQKSLRIQLRLRLDEICQHKTLSRGGLKVLPLLLLLDSQSEDLRSTNTTSNIKRKTHFQVGSSLTCFVVFLFTGGFDSDCDLVSKLLLNGDSSGELLLMISIPLVLLIDQIS